MSGAGRTQVGNTLEDLGWFVIDNLPVELIPKVAELARFQDAGTPVALVVGTGRDRRRSVRRWPSCAPRARRADGLPRRLHATLVRRYERRSAAIPWWLATGTVEGAIEEERRCWRRCARAADIVIDTVRPERLRPADPGRPSCSAIERRGFHADHASSSFGYKHGVPATSTW